MHQRFVKAGWRGGAGRGVNKNTGEQDADDDVDDYSTLARRRESQTPWPSTALHASLYLFVRMLRSNS
eukprot:3323431-Pyramimonas_sp.AAC.1